MGYIYVIVNRVDDKKYVGQTTRSDINNRWKEHLRTNTNCVYLKRAFAKHGIDNFDFRIVCICFDEDCNKLEEFYIAKYASLAPAGYNLRAGGNSSKWSEDVKARISLGVRRAIENGTFVVRKGAYGGRQVGYRHTEETRRKMSKPKTHLWKRVAHTDEHGNVIAEYGNVVIAAEAVGCSHQGIRGVCNGHRKRCKGMYFKFV